MSWLSDIILAMRNLGGIAPYAELYREVQKIRNEPLPASWQAIIRRVIETNSSDSEVFNGTSNLFFSVEGLGNGVWGLRESLRSTPTASDIETVGITESLRIKCETYRVLRDTLLAREIKLLHQDKCQICGLALCLPDGRTYSEAHHIRPLGNPHNGPDVAGNILVLCPNHHVQCDYQFIKLSFEQLRLHSKHQIDAEYIRYHNDLIDART